LSQPKIESNVSIGSVKRLLFKPSGRTVWIVVGKDNEHWADPDLGFCTCKDFYFKALSGGAECYHLNSVRKAIEKSEQNTIEFTDDEYVQILQAIVDDQSSVLRSR
jgi:predicted nucleic acid-binding Zn finger protein